jgi:hypothetical protein
VPSKAPTPAIAGGKAAPKKTVAGTPAPVVASPPAPVQPVAVAPLVTSDTATGGNSSDTPAVVTNAGDTILTDLLEKVVALSSQLKTMHSSLKLLVKEYDKQKKIIDKVQKKKEKAKKSPSGFAKPCKISDELCEFIGIAKGTEQSRTDITRFINSYVKQHNLNNPQNRREFFPDKKLKAILNVKDGEKVTYFVLQRLIAHHFPPSMSKLAAAAKVVA